MIPIGEDLLAGLRGWAPKGGPLEAFLIAYACGHVDLRLFACAIKSVNEARQNPGARFYEMYGRTPTAPGWDADACTSVLALMQDELQTIFNHAVAEELAALFGGSSDRNL